MTGHIYGQRQVRILLVLHIGLDFTPLIREVSGLLGFESLFLDYFWLFWIVFFILASAFELVGTKEYKYKKIAFALQGFGAYPATVQCDTGVGGVQLRESYDDLIVQC